MSQAEELHRAQQRKLIVLNLINGVEAEDAARAFSCSREQVMREFEFAVRKMRSYCFERRMPAFLIENLAQARERREVFLHYLDRISFLRGPRHKKIGTQTITEENYRRL